MRSQRCESKSYGASLLRSRVHPATGCAYLIESEDASNDSNLVLQLALTELVKQVMRELAQDNEADHLQVNLLQKAIQTTTQLIEEWAATVARFDLPLYFERIYRSQRWVAKEMTELGLRLRQARQGELLRPPRVILDVPVPFRVTELGTRGTSQGLIAQPLGACRLNLDEMRQAYRVRGMGYPWEVEVEKITFVVEADGSITTFLEGFPGSIIEQAKTALVQLASDLYLPAED